MWLCGSNISLHQTALLLFSAWNNWHLLWFRLLCEPSPVDFWTITINLYYAAVIVLLYWRCWGIFSRDRSPGVYVQSEEYSPLNTQIALLFGTTHINVSVAKGILNGYLHCKSLRNWGNGIRAQSASHLNFASSKSNPSFLKFLFQEKRIQRVEMQWLTTRLQGIRISHKKNISLFPMKFSYIDFLFWAPFLYSLFRANAQG